MAIYRDPRLQPTAFSTPEDRPDAVSSFLQQLMDALQQPEQDAEDLVAQPRTPGQFLMSGIQNAYAFQPEDQRLQRGQMLWEAGQEAQAARSARPAQVNLARQGQADRRIQRLTQGVNVASQAEYRQAQALKAGQPGGGKFNPDILVSVKRRGPDGKPVQELMLRSEAAERLRRGEQLVFDTPYAMQARPGFREGQGAMYDEFDPFTGRGLEGLQPLPSTMDRQGATMGVIAANSLLTASRGFRELARTTGPFARAAQDIGRRLPLIGQTLSSYFNPKGEVTAALLTLARQMFVYTVSGKQVNQEEYDHLFESTPSVGENIQSAGPKLAEFMRTVQIILRRNNAIYPGLIDPEIMRAVDEGVFNFESLSQPQTPQRPSPMAPTKLDDILEP